MGVVAAAGHRRHPAADGQVLGRLKAHAGLLIDPDRPEGDAVGIPLIGLRLVDQAGRARGEGAVDPLGPEVGGSIMWESEESRG